MNILLRSAFAIMSAAAILLPLQQAEAAKAKPATTRPITASYTKDQCLKDGGKIDRKSGSIICLLAPAAAAVVKSKSNITNN